VHWWKIKNPAYTQAEGRHELFNDARASGEKAGVAGRFIAAPTVVGE
jgi:hypothetical protein